MGYQVGFQCFDSLQQAQDYKYSSVAPVINQNNQLVQPEKINGQWQLNGSQIIDSFPTCSPLDQFQDGVESGWGFIALTVGILCVAIMRRGL